MARLCALLRALGVPGGRGGRGGHGVWHRRGDVFMYYKSLIGLASRGAPRRLRRAVEPRLWLWVEGRVCVWGGG